MANLQTVVSSLSTDVRVFCAHTGRNDAWTHSLQWVTCSWAHSLQIAVPDWTFPLQSFPEEPASLWGSARVLSLCPCGAELLLERLGAFPLTAVHFIPEESQNAGGHTWTRSAFSCGEATAAVHVSLLCCKSIWIYYLQKIKVKQSPVQTCWTLATSLPGMRPQLSH